MGLWAWLTEETHQESGRRTWLSSRPIMWCGKVVDSGVLEDWRPGGGRVTCSGCRRKMVKAGLNPD